MVAVLLVVVAALSTVVTMLSMEVAGLSLLLQVAGGGCVIDVGVRVVVSSSNWCTVVNADQWMDADGELIGGYESMWWVVNEVVGDVVIQRWLHTTSKLLYKVYEINQSILTTGPGLTKTQCIAVWPPPLGLECDRMECEAVCTLSNPQVVM